MQITPLASSSKGNAYVVEQDGVAVLIDDGLAYRTLKGRLVQIGLSPESIKGILITHSHTDHTSGLATFLRHHPSVGLYANAMTAETIICDRGLPEANFICFENGQEFEIGPFAISAFSVPHDTSDPVGYLMRVREGDKTVTYFHATDVGAPLDSVGLKLREADLATLESNHDPVLLRESGRSPLLIRRIAGRSGHLSNDEAAELVRRFASPRLRRLYLAHLSADCNSPLLAERSMRSALKAICRTDICVEVCAP